VAFLFGGIIRLSKWQILRTKYPFGEVKRGCKRVRLKRPAQPLRLKRALPGTPDLQEGDDGTALAQGDNLLHHAPAVRATVDVVAEEDKRDCWVGWMPSRRLARALAHP
jgi:hypothetical protein